VQNITLNDQFVANSSITFEYILGGERLVSSVEFPQLAAFMTKSSETPKQQQSASMLVSNTKFNQTKAFAQAESSSEALGLKYRGRAPFDGKVRQIEYLSDEAHGLVRIDGADAYFLDLHQQTALCLLDDPSGRLALELLLGPVTVVFFGARGLYCLHAGCVDTPNGAIALIAESGVGKSTLSTSCGDSWVQISDDVLLVNAQTLRICGNFPQLKLPYAQSDFFNASNQIEVPPISAIVRLTAEPSESIKLERMGARDCLLQLVRHSVGAKLFNADELNRHTLFSAHLASSMPMWQAFYPRSMAKLPDVRRAICQALDDL
jgi:hypothetical protein